MTGWLHIATLVVYGTAAVLMSVSFARNDRSLTRAGSVVLAVGLFVHTWALFEYVSQWHELPLVGLGPSLSTLAYLIGIGTLIASTLGHVLTFGLVLIPVVVMLVAVSVSVGVTPAEEALAFQSIWFVQHVVFAFIGYVGLSVSFGAGLMYLLQFRELKSKHFGAIFRFFPPLDTLDRLGRLGLMVGFPFLTLALLVGWAWTARFQGVSAPENPKLIWVIISWFVFIGALLARTGKGGRGHRGAVASVVGFVVVVIVYLVLRVQSSQGGFL